MERIVEHRARRELDKLRSKQKELDAANELESKRRRAEMLAQKQATARRKRAEMSETERTFFRLCAKQSWRIRGDHSLAVLQNLVSSNLLDESKA